MDDHMRDVPKGMIIYEQGKEGDTFGYLVSGKVGLYLNYGEPEQFALDEIGPDEGFGEMGLLNGGKRAVTVVALEDSQLLEFSKSELDRFVIEQPEAAVRLLKAMSRRLQGATDEIVLAHSTIKEMIEEMGDRPIKKESLKAKLKRYASFFFELPPDIPPEVYMDYYGRMNQH